VGPKAMIIQMDQVGLNGNK